MCTADLSSNLVRSNILFCAAIWIYNTNKYQINIPVRYNVFALKKKKTLKSRKGIYSAVKKYLL